MKVITHTVQGSKAPTSIDLCADGRHDAWLNEEYPCYLGVAYGAHAGSCVVCEPLVPTPEQCLGCDKPLNPDGDPEHERCVDCALDYLSSGCDADTDPEWVREAERRIRARTQTQGV